MTLKAPGIKTHQDALQCIHPGTSQKISFTGTSQQSAAVSTDTNAIELFATKDCWLTFGANPTATASPGGSFFLAGGLFKTYGITPGHKIAVIRNSDSGDLHIIEAAG